MVAGTGQVPVRYGLAVLVQVLERRGQGLHRLLQPHRLARKLVDLTLDVARSALQYRFLSVPDAFIDRLDPLLVAFYHLVYDLEENRPRAFYDAIGLLLHPSAQPVKHRG